MKTKECFKCEQVLPLDEFYRHPQMGDGHLGKCKECAKRDVRANYAKDIERSRARDRNRYQNDPRVRERIAQTSKRWRERHPERRKAQLTAGNALRGKHLKRETACADCGAVGRRLHKHHEDYSKPLDVIWLCVPCHRKRHDQKRRATA